MKDEGPTAYRTLLVKQAPNLWTIGGCNSATGHASVVMALENGIDYFLKTAKPVIEGKSKSVRVTDGAYDNWFTTIQSELRKSVLVVHLVAVSPGILFLKSIQLFILGVNLTIGGKLISQTTVI